MKAISFIVIVVAILGLLIKSVSAYAYFTGKEFADSNLKTGLLCIATFGAMVVGCSVYLIHRLP